MEFVGVGNRIKFAEGGEIQIAGVTLPKVCRWVDDGEGGFLTVWQTVGAVGCFRKTLFWKTNWRNPPRISLEVSLKESKRIFDFNKVWGLSCLFCHAAILTAPSAYFILRLESIGVTFISGFYHWVHKNTSVWLHLWISIIICNTKYCQRHKLLNWEMPDSQSLITAVWSQNAHLRSN